MHVLKSFRPTNTQKQVLATILSAQTPAVAAQTIASTSNAKAARNILAQLGLISFTDGSAALTDKGMAVAYDSGIADEGGQLTDAGRQLVGGDNGGGLNSMGMPEEEPPLGGVPADDPLAAPPMESFSFLRELMRV